MSPSSRQRALSGAEATREGALVPWLAADVVAAVRAHARATGGTFIEALEVLVLAGARLEEHLPVGETPASEAICVSAEVAQLLEEYATHADELSRIRGVDAPPMTKGRAAELLITAACEELIR